MTGVEDLGHPERYRQINGVFYDLWRFGSNALVGWRPTRMGIEVVTVPKVRLFSAEKLHPRVFGGPRRMGDNTFNEVADSFDAQPIEVRLDVPIGEGPGDADPKVVDSLFEPYAVTKTAFRAVLLIDIVGFSKASPEQQAAQLSTLEFALNLAGETARQRGLKVDLARTTTGDGFYVWNDQKGFLEDVDFFCAVVFFLLFFSAIGRVTRTPGAVPQLRLCLGMGSHFLYRQPRRGGGDAGQFIVGEVTIKVARLINEARAGQILIGDFERPLEGAPVIFNAERFLLAVSERISQLKDIRVIGTKVERISFYLTGPRNDSGQHVPSVIKVVDKHGFEHLCYNAKLNAFCDQGEPHYCGLQHSELPTG